MANHAALIRQENPGLDVARRGRNYVEFNLPDGKKRHVATIDPLHIRNQPDVEIDTAWEDGDGQPYFKKMVKSDYNVYAGLNSSVTFNAGQIIEYRQPDTNAWVKVQPQDLVWENEWGSTQYISAPQGVAAQINDDILYWPGAYGAGRNFQWQAQTKRLRKDLILDSLAQLGAPPAWMTPELVQLRLQFLFEKSANVQIWYKSGDGEYQLWDEATPVQTNVRIEFRQGDTRLWWFEPAHAYAADNADPFLLSTRLTRSGDVLFVEIVIPWTWLLAAEYPVVVDPTFTDGYGGDATTYKDDHLRAAHSTTNYGTTEYLRIAVGTGYVILLGFDLSSIDAGATCDSATLYLYAYGPASADGTVYIRRLAAANDGWTEAGATWAHAVEDTVEWAGAAGASVEGTDYIAAVIGSFTYVGTGNGGAGGDEYAQALTASAIEDEFDGPVSFHIVSTHTVDNYTTFMSSDYGTAAERPKLVVEYTAAGGAPYTLTADAAGSYALAGKDPTLAAARKLALDAGAYTLAGKDAGVLRGYPLAADAGNYTLAGKDPALIAARALAADAGAYTLAGKDAALTIARLLTADAAGAYTLTGRDATLTYATAGAYTLTADNAGAYALTGHAAGLIAARVLAPDTGVYTLTGADAALVRGFLLALDAGAYTTSGADPTLTAALRLDAGAGAYTTTGQDAALTIARALAAEAGSYVVTGADAGLVLARVLGLDAGAYTVAGKDATLTADVLTDYTLTADAAGAYALTGLPVTIIYSGLVTPDDRIYVVAAEGRVYIVAAESRTHTVAAEGRVYTAA